jgi:hypothetical protein
MNMTAIRAQAKAIGVTAPGKMRKGDLIRAIQRQEGNQSCFAAAWSAECQQMDCCWRGECLEKQKS